MLQINNLTKTYKGGKVGAKDITIHIKPGDIFGFIGPNGAGKTTTIKCATGLLEFEQGEILVNGISLKNDPIGCKKIMAYVPDNPELYDHLTGISYLNFICDIYEVDSSVRNEKIKFFADKLDLFDDLGNIISSYSHGMKQKLAIISALIHSPKLLVLDEPFVGLDPKASFILKEMLKEICTQGGAVFFSTHVLEVAEKLCNRIAIIKDAKIMVYGETKEIIGDQSLENLFLELVE